MATPTEPQLPHDEHQSDKASEREQSDMQQQSDKASERESSPSRWPPPPLPLADPSAPLSSPPPAKQSDMQQQSDKASERESSPSRWPPPPLPPADPSAPLSSPPPAEYVKGNRIETILKSNLQKSDKASEREQSDRQQQSDKASERESSPSRRLPPPLSPADPSAPLSSPPPAESVKGNRIETILKSNLQKDAGNEAYRTGNYVEAVEEYTSAISCKTDQSRPFLAICFCNRATAYQQLGQITDAILDCSVAMALDENYVKAVSMRANLYEQIRDYQQAASDLQKLISILEKRSQHSSSSNENELEDARKCLSSMQKHAKKKTPLDLYLILGVKRANTEPEIKEAYRKAILKHHPDKAGQLLVRDIGDDGQFWKEIADSVLKDSDRLFKMIGGAYAVLSDPQKRRQYNMRNASIRSTSMNGSGGRDSENTESHLTVDDRIQNRMISIWERQRMKDEQKKSNIRDHPTLECVVPFIREGLCQIVNQFKRIHR